MARSALLAQLLCVCGWKFTACEAGQSGDGGRRSRDAAGRELLRAPAQAGVYPNDPNPNALIPACCRVNLEEGESKEESRAVYCSLLRSAQRPAWQQRRRSRADPAPCAAASAQRCRAVRLRGRLLPGPSQAVTGKERFKPAPAGRTTPLSKHRREQLLCLF